MTRTIFEEIVAFIEDMATSEDASFEAAEYLSGIADANPDDYHSFCSYLGIDATEGIENVANFILSNNYAFASNPFAVGVVNASRMGLRASNIW